MQGSMLTAYAADTRRLPVCGERPQPATITVMVGAIGDSYELSRIARTITVTVWRWRPATPLSAQVAAQRVQLRLRREAGGGELVERQHRAQRAGADRLPCGDGRGEVRLRRRRRHVGRR